MVMTRIGIVNGSAEVTEMLDLCLTRAGFAVVAMPGRARPWGADLSAQVTRQGIQVVVFDLDTPVVGNWNWLLALQSRDPDLSSVVMTTSRRKSLDGPACRGGNVVFIGQPYQLDRLVERVRRAAQKPAPSFCGLDTSSVTV